MIGTGPYDSLREYVEAIEEHGKLIRIDEIDQDAYELASCTSYWINMDG